MDVWKTSLNASSVCCATVVFKRLKLLCLTFNLNWPLRLNDPKALNIDWTVVKRLFIYWFKHQHWCGWYVSIYTQLLQYTQSHETNPPSLFHTPLSSSTSVFQTPSIPLFHQLLTVDSALGKSGRGLILKAEWRHVGYQGPELQGNQGTSSGGYVQTASRVKTRRNISYSVWTFSTCEDVFLKRHGHLWM